MDKIKKISIIAFASVLIFTGSAFLQTGRIEADTIPESCAKSYPVNSPGYTKCVDDLTLADSNLNHQSSCGITEVGCQIMETVLPGIANMALSLASLITGLGGVVLNGVVFNTVVNVSDNYSRIKAIDETWRVVRDIANMAFIFVLLYAAIRTILGLESGTQKIVVNVVVVAILINFSLFITKIVIDTSNLLALTFYEAIVPGALTRSADWTTQFGLSEAFMQHLNLQTLYQAGANLGPTSIITIGVVGSIMLLIAGFVFFAVALLFIIRYVVLILVLVLSPIAFISFVLPKGTGIDKYKQQWMDALMGQAFFAPIYFMLTWITLRLLGGITSSFGGTAAIADSKSLGGLTSSVIDGTLNSGAFIMFINFIIVIVMLIASLIVAKEWANKGGVGAGGLASKWAGSIMGGGGGWIGRRTAGAAGNWLSNREGLQTAAKEKRGLAGAGARLALYASKKARSGTFDARNATIPTSVIGDVIEGTVGRTTIGKKIGLDEVRIGSIPVGSMAANQMGLGKGGTEGAREEQKAKAKRIEAREKAIDDDYREALAKKAISKGKAAADKPIATRTPADEALIAEMQKVIKDMSNKEITALDHNTLANEKVAEALTATHLKAIDEDKEGKFSESEKREVFEKHFAKVATAVENIRNGVGTADDDNAIRSISDKEIDYIPASIFDPMRLDPATPAGATPEGGRSRAFIKTLTQPQIDNLTKGDKLIASGRQAVKDARNRPLKEGFRGAAAGTGPWTGAGSPVDIMEKIGEPALAKMDATYNPATGANVDIPTLNNPNILEIYTPSVLNKMAAQSELNPPKRSAIRNAILDEVHGNPVLSAALTALNTPVPPATTVTPAQRQAILAGLPNNRAKRLVSSASWLESEIGINIF